MYTKCVPAASGGQKKAQIDHYPQKTVVESHFQVFALRTDKSIIDISLATKKTSKHRASTFHIHTDVHQHHQHPQHHQHRYQDLVDPFKQSNQQGSPRSVISLSSARLTSPVGPWMVSVALRRRSSELHYSPRSIQAHGMNGATHSHGIYSTSDSFFVDILPIDLSLM